MGYTGGPNGLTVAYDIPPGGMFEHDKLLKELAGPEATETSFGSGWYPFMGHFRDVGLSYPTPEARAAAVERFKQHARIFRVYTSS